MRSCDSDLRTTVDVYRRILKYPPFALRRGKGPMRIVHELPSGATVIAAAPEGVTVEDGEKLFAAMYLSKDTREFNYSGLSVVGGTFHIADLRRLIGSNDERGLIEALECVAKLTITYHLDKQRIVTHCLHEIRFDNSTGIVTALFNAIFFRACREKGLTISLDHYCSLSPVGKNLYSFLVSNSGGTFAEETLISRCNISSAALTDARKQLQKALKDLVARHIISGYSLTGRGGTRRVRIIRGTPKKISVALPNGTADETSHLMSDKALRVSSISTHSIIPP